MKSSSLRGSWLPTGYDFKQQYKYVVEYLSKKPANQFDIQLQSILDNGQFILSTHPTHRVILHSEVIQNLRNFYEASLCEIPV
jgi:hypothetical protein